MKNYLTEAIGTFFLVLTAGLMTREQSELAPLVIGSAMMVMVYMGRHVSGAHYNPAISLAVMMRGRLERKELMPYWVSQVVGAFLAAVVVNFISGAIVAPAPAADASRVGALTVELLFTFALCLVVLNSATAKKTEGNSYYGLAIGFTVAVGTFAGGPISGGALNPAIGIGPILMNALTGGGSIGELWLYLLGPLVGGAVAAFVFRVQNPDDV